VHHRWQKLSTAAIGLGLLFGALPAAATTIPPGSVQVFVNSILDPNNKTVRADCPAGKRVVGGGALTAGGAHVIISEERPVSDARGDGFVITAEEDQVGVAGVWSAQSFAFCAPAPPGYQIVPMPGAPTSASATSTTAQCPPGKFLIGSGGQITGGLGQVDLGMFPNGGNGSLANASAAFAKEDADGFAGNYQVNSFAICASQNAIGDFAVFRALSATDTNPNKTVTVACQNGLRATGTAGLTDVPNGTHIQFARPNVTNAPSQVTVAAAAAAPVSRSWTIDATVFCAR
jgi:hypothetical protein